VVATLINVLLLPAFMADRDLDELVREYFSWFVEHDPIAATYLGVHRYDDRMPDGSVEGKLDEIDRMGDFLSRLLELDAGGLSPPARIDRGALAHRLRVRLYEEDVLRFWEAFPEAPFAVGAAIHPLYMREFAPLEDRLETIAVRLTRCPEFLEVSRARVVAPNRLWAELALDAARRLPGLLADIVETGKERLKGDAAALEEAAARTVSALGETAEWIEYELLPRGKEEVGIGASRFEELLALRELGLTANEMYELGWRYLRESEAELARLAGQVKEGASVEEASEIVSEKRPKAFAEALAYTREVMEESRRFVVEKGLATVPANEDLKVIETPSHLRPVIPFAAFSPPGKFDSRQQGLYMVTPVEDRPEMLREHNYAKTRNTAVHEGYPGHHLHMVCANMNPSLARGLVRAVETIEGWAHYCEDMMKENGFHDDAETRFVQVRDQIWRACRIIIDIDLHRRRMGFDEAVDFLVTRARMERAGAVAEVKRYTYNPGYQLSYLIGKHLIKGLREEVRTRMGDAYSDRFFHDTFLYAGLLPFRYIRELFRQKLEGLERVAEAGPPP
jgi:uncharacterized protein (DUF885 family)